jgi:hypothetical protein
LFTELLPGKNEGCPANEWGTFDPNPTAVGFHLPLDHCQSDPACFKVVLALQGLEYLENPLVELLRNAGAIIADADFHKLVQ